MRLLDLFCGGGGAGMGYHRAGFEVVGVDIKPQKHYPFEFHCADAFAFLEKHGHEFDVIHASPPCQAYSIMRNLSWNRDRIYPKLIDETRAGLLRSGKTYVIENVRGAPLDASYLCGTMFGLPFFNHRLFETNFFWMHPPHAPHDFVIKSGKNFGKDGGRRKLTSKLFGIDWMNCDELSQAIPPAYTEWIGKRLLEALR